MPSIVKFVLGDRFLAVAGLSLALSTGCTQSSTPATDRAAAPASPKAAATEVTQTAANDQAPAAAGTADAAAAPTASASGAQAREAGKPVISEYAPGVPQVLLSSRDNELCKVGVGEVLPTIELPKLGGGNASLESLAGAKATVVLFWTTDRWMSETALRDLAGLKVGDDVHFVGINVGGKADDAQKLIAKTGAKFTQLVDAKGEALAQVGKDSLPRIYVLDGERRIAWFDIEFSESTRRELQQTLASLAGGDAK